MENTRHKIFKAFTSRIGLYHGLIFQTKNYLNDSIKLRKSGEQPPFGFFMGAHLVFRNHLTGKHEFAHTHKVTTKNIEKTIDTFHIHFSNFCIAQCFEAFETFLKDVITLKLTRNKRLAKKINSKIDPSNVKLCRKSIEEICRKDNKYNKQLFKIISALSATPSSEINHLLAQLNEWYIVFSETRHCIVHSNNNLDSTRANNWTEYQMGILRTFLLKEKKGGKYVINTYPKYGRIIETIVMHAQLIYDCLSIE
jgi:hypothetical protein